MRRTIADDNSAHTNDHLKDEVLGVFIGSCGGRVRRIVDTVSSMLTYGNDGNMKVLGEEIIRVAVVDAMREACRESARLLAREWGMSMEDAFVLLSIRGDVGVAQACKPSPFVSIARVVLPKLDAIPSPFRT
jgi:hypothetical protein